MVRLYLWLGAFASGDAVEVLVLGVKSLQLGDVATVAAAAAAALAVSVSLLVRGGEPGDEFRIGLNFGSSMLSGDICRLPKLLTVGEVTEGENVRFLFDPDTTGNDLKLTLSLIDSRCRCGEYRKELDTVGDEIDAENGVNS